MSEDKDDVKEVFEPKTFEGMKLAIEKINKMLSKIKNKWNFAIIANHLKLKYI